MRVVLADGTRLDDVFEERTAKFVVLRHAGPVPGGSVRSMRIIKGSSRPANG